MDSDWIQRQAMRVEVNAETIGRIIEEHHPPHEKLGRLATQSDRQC